MAIYLRIATLQLPDMTLAMPLLGPNALPKITPYQVNVIKKLDKIVMRDPKLKRPLIRSVFAPISDRLGKIAGPLVPKSARHAADPYEDADADPVADFQITRNIGDFLSVPVVESTTEHAERMAHQARGQHLSRQEEWETLSGLIFDADQARTKTTGGMPVADLLMYGARADVVLAAEHALFDGQPAKGAQLLAGIEALEQVLSDHPDNYPIALVVAHAHIDMGWAWRGTGWLVDLKPRNHEALSAHFDRAAGILNTFQGMEALSPALAAARCALLSGYPHSRERVADDYETLIDLDRENPHHMRSMGNHLLPRWFGNLAELELEARRTASRTQDLWGAGAYTWVYFDAIVIDDEACAQVEADFFIEGLRDILRHSPDQHTANLLAAYCAIAVRAGCGSGDEADLVRHQLIDCANWIIRDHLTEIHPLVWAHAASGFNNSVRVPSVAKFSDHGRKNALEVIAKSFCDDIARGHRITFTPEGPSVTAG